MEYTQWVWTNESLSLNQTGLNPCCNGIYSMRMGLIKTINNKIVLILVVMEYTQWVLM